MTKQQLLQSIITLLEADLALFTAAARAAHQAATHEECIPDNKYDTTALEASYIAQGQANRAQEIRVALKNYSGLILHSFAGSSPICLTALVTLEDEDGNRRRLFLGPSAGGLKVSDPAGEIVVITPASPLGSSLLGLRVGDEVESGVSSTVTSFTITAIC